MQAVNLLDKTLLFTSCCCTLIKPHQLANLWPQLGNRCSLRPLLDLGLDLSLGSVSSVAAACGQTNFLSSNHEGKVRSHDAGANYTHVPIYIYIHIHTYTYACMYVFAYTRVVRGSGNWQLANGNGQRATFKSHQPRMQSS